MRELLNRKHKSILSPKDDEEWVYKKKSADYTFYAIVMSIPIDMYAIFYLRGEAQKRMRSFSNRYVFFLLPIFFLTSHIHRQNLRDITKRYLTHLSDQELD